MRAIGPVLLCTHQDCTHQRTWPTSGAKLVDMDLHPEWVDRSTGDATCSCHWPAAQAIFPCDEALRRKGVVLTRSPT